MPRTVEMLYSKREEPKMDVDDLLSRLASGLIEGLDRGVPLPTRLCRSAASALGCDGGAITLAYMHAERVTVATTDDTALTLEEMQEVVGEGPGPDAFTSGTYHRLAYPEGDDTDARWPLLASESLSIISPIVVHALPIPHTRGVLGVLTLYQRDPRGDIDLESGLAVARVVGGALLADGPSDAGANGPWAERAEVHQATGMVLAQLGIPETDALALIRAHAYSHDQSVARSAHAVVTSELSFANTADQEIEAT
jgi:hypothetical protein